MAFFNSFASEFSTGGMALLPDTNHVKAVGLDYWRWIGDFSNWDRQPETAAIAGDEPGDTPSRLQPLAILALAALAWVPFLGGAFLL